MEQLLLDSQLQVMMRRHHLFMVQEWLNIHLLNIQVQGGYQGLNDYDVQINGYDIRATTSADDPFSLGRPFGMGCIPRTVLLLLKRLR